MAAIFNSKRLVFRQPIQFNCFHNKLIINKQEDNAVFSARSQHKFFSRLNTSAPNINIQKLKTTDKPFIKPITNRNHTLSLPQHNHYTPATETAALYPFYHPHSKQKRKQLSLHNFGQLIHLHEIPIRLCHP